MLELMRHGRMYPGRLVTQLERIEGAYEMFGNQRDGVVKVATRP